MTIEIQSLQNTTQAHPTTDSGGAATGVQHTSQNLTFIWHDRGSSMYVYAPSPGFDWQDSLSLKASHFNRTWVAISKRKTHCNPTISVIFSIQLRRYNNIGLRLIRVIATVLSVIYLLTCLDNSAHHCAMVCLRKTYKYTP